MSASPNPPGTAEPVVVTFDQVSKALGTTEAMGHLEEAANTDQETDNVEKAAIMASIGNVLERLRLAEAAAGAKVLTTPHDARAARLQSLIASGEAAQLGLLPLASGGQEAIFDTQDRAGWASVAWEKLKHLRKHDLVRPPGTKAESFPEKARIAVVGDWGTGLYGAPRIAKAIVEDSDPFAMLLHLGDVYYSGTLDEVRARFLGAWPTRNEAVSRALNSNHEMYSGGDAYFEQTLPAFGQSGSYFACQNGHWTLIGLDVAYEDHDIDDEQAWWVDEVVRTAGSRKVVFFSHHQLYSNIENEQGRRLWSHSRFGALLRSRRVFAWYWGHEHRCTVYEDPDRDFGIYGRCIGHGGMPQNRNATIGLPRATDARYGDADWRVVAETNVAGHLLSRAVVLEGRNEYIYGEEEKFGPHGYATLEFDGPHLREEVRSADGIVIYSRQLC